MSGELSEVTQGWQDTYDVVTQYTEDITALEAEPLSNCQQPEQNIEDIEALALSSTHLSGLKVPSVSM